MHVAFKMNYAYHATHLFFATGGWMLFEDVHTHQRRSRIRLEVYSPSSRSNATGELTWIIGLLPAGTR
jgi:hypothetical protein